VQLQTLTIWNALQQLQVPTLLFLNKLDRLGARPDEVTAEIRSMLSPCVINLQKVAGAGKKSPQILSEISDGKVSRDVVEALADFDDLMLAKFLAGADVAQAELETALRSLVHDRQVFPIFSGVAMEGLGVDSLLDAICTYLPPPGGEPDHDLSAIVFKIEGATDNGRMSYIRVLNGTLEQRDRLTVAGSEIDEKATRILKLTPGRGYETAQKLEAGDIGILCGLKETHVGAVLGDAEGVAALSSTVEPLLTARIFPEDDARWGDLIEALRVLEDEEPLLNVEWLEEQREINVAFFGEVQMEIILGLLDERFGLMAKFSRPRIIYKEAPMMMATARVELRTHGFADIELKVEPGEPGSGYVYEQEVRADKIYYKFIKQIPEVIDEARQKGPRGWEVTDLKVTLVDGLSRYDMGTTHADFKIVAPQALSVALEDAGTYLLEPIMAFEVRVPEQFRAAIYRDLVKMRANFQDPTPVGGYLTFVGKVPFVEIFDKTAALYTSSQGQGTIKTSFDGYQRVAD
jgi:ribosomal protection tetracycline resistance protein